MSKMALTTSVYFAPVGPEDHVGTDRAQRRVPTVIRERVQHRTRKGAGIVFRSFGLKLDEGQVRGWSRHVLSVRPRHVKSSQSPPRGPASAIVIVAAAPRSKLFVPRRDGDLHVVRAIIHIDVQRSANAAIGTRSRDGERTRVRRELAVRRQRLGANIVGIEVVQLDDTETDAKTVRNEFGQPLSSSRTASCSMSPISSLLMYLRSRPSTVMSSSTSSAPHPDVSSSQMRRGAATRAAEKQRQIGPGRRS